MKKTNYDINDITGNAKGGNEDETKSVSEDLFIEVFKFISKWHISYRTVKSDFKYFYFYFKLKNLRHG